MDAMSIVLAQGATSMGIMSIVLAQRATRTNIFLLSFIGYSIMTDVIIKKSSKKDKKYDAVIHGKKTISFGAVGYSDFTKHKNEERKDRYIARHKVNQDWNDCNTAGFWSRWITWNKPTIEQSVSDIDKRFKGLNVSLKTPELS